MKLEILISSLVALVTCVPFDMSSQVNQQLRTKPLAHVIYYGSCTEDDLDPQMLKECARYACWKGAAAGEKVIQRSGCNEDVSCDDSERNTEISSDKEWPDCCPSPVCKRKEESSLPVPREQLAHIIYDGSCTEDDLDPKIFNECAMHTCWKSPTTGQKVMQRSGCNEDVSCDDSERNTEISSDKQWPDCCPSPVCKGEESSLPVPLEELAHIIYAGNCTREDIDPEIWKECLLHTCWKCPETGYIATQTFRCNEDVSCSGLLRNDVVRWDTKWPDCCPSPACVDESVWRISH